MTKQSYYQMPKIDMTFIDLDQAERDLVAGIVNSKTGELRASKPSLPKKVKVADPSSPYGYHYDYASPQDADKGRVAYLWRMVAFFVSPHPQHQCMPCMAFCDLPHYGGANERRDEENRLDALASKVVDSIPVAQWKGVSRWAKAMGQ